MTEGEWGPTWLFKPDMEYCINWDDHEILPSHYQKIVQENVYCNWMLSFKIHNGRHGRAWLNTTDQFLLHLPFLVISDLVWTIVSTMTGVKSTIINVKAGSQQETKLTRTIPPYFLFLLAHLQYSCCCNIEVNDQSTEHRALHTVIIRECWGVGMVAGLTRSSGHNHNVNSGSR